MFFLHAQAQATAERCCQIDTRLCRPLPRAGTAAVGPFDPWESTISSSRLCRGRSHCQPKAVRAFLLHNPPRGLIVLRLSIWANCCAPAAALTCAPAGTRLKFETYKNPAVGLSDLTSTSPSCLDLSSTLHLLRPTRTQGQVPTSPNSTTGNESHLIYHPLTLPTHLLPTHPSGAPGS